MEEKKGQVDIRAIVALLKSKKKTFYKIWVITIIVAGILIIPRPSYYSCSVKLAPEIVSAQSSGLSSLASSLGMNLGNLRSRDAFYPLIYPELMSSSEFIVGLFDVQIETSDGEIKTDYYNYMTEYQNKNWLIAPFYAIVNSVISIFRGNDIKEDIQEAINPFRLSKKNYLLVNKIKKDLIRCNIDKKTNVVSIVVTDQDPLVCALMADSVRVHLQNHIIDYRTKKSRIDEEHYKSLTDKAQKDYEDALAAYASFKDTHKNVQSFPHVAEQERLKHDLEFKYSTFTSFNTQYQASKAQVREQTPSFTVLQSASVPIKPAGPRRVRFIIGMLLLVSFVSSIWFIRSKLVSLV